MNVWYYELLCYLIPLHFLPLRVHSLRILSPSPILSNIQPRQHNSTMISRGHHCRGIIGRVLASSNNNKTRFPINRFPSAVSQPPSSNFSTSYLQIFGPHVHINEFSTFTKSSYVHPLSQIVLEHLQANHSRWVQQNRLDTALKLNKDGTFVLRFPNPDGIRTSEVDGSSIHSGSIW